MHRQHRSAAERAALIEQYKSSGLSAEVFMARAGIPSSTFYQWLARERAALTTKPIRMARVVRRGAGEQVAAVTATSTLCIEVGATVVRVSAGFDRVTLNEVLDVLERRKQ